MRTTCLLLALLWASCADENPPPPAHPPAGNASRVETPPPPADAVRAEAYVGLSYPPLPDSLEKREGALLQVPGREAADVSYSFAEVHRGTTRLLWLAHLDGRNAQGEASWTVRDAVVLPPVAEGEALYLHGCRRGDETRLAALMAVAEAEQLTQARLAWRADPDAGRLVPVDPSGVTCRNPGYGV